MAGQEHGRPGPAAEGKPEPVRSQEDHAAERARAEQERRVRRARQVRLAKVAFLLAVVVILIVFVIANSQRVTVDFVFADADIGLIWVMLACGLLGGIAGYVIGRPGKELRRERKGGRERSERRPG